MQPVHRFYKADSLLFTLEDATEYDTATPYRYAVSRFVEVANLIRRGEVITVISGDELIQPVNLKTIDDLWCWLSVHFSGFERYIS